MWVTLFILLACLCQVRGELRRRLSIDHLSLDAAGAYLSGDTATATFSISGEEASNVFCLWYDSAGEPITGCDSTKAIKPDADGKYTSACKLIGNKYGMSEVKCQSQDGNNGIQTTEVKAFEVVMSTGGGIYTESDDKPEDDDKTAPDPSQDPGKGPQPKQDDDGGPAPAPGPTNHDFDDDYAVTYAPTENVAPGPGPQPAPSPDPGPMTFDDDGGPAPIPAPIPGPDGPVIEDDIAPHPGPVPGPLDPKDADDDDWHPPTEGPTSDISVSLTVAMTISGVSKASWDKDTSSYNSAWALAMVRTITSYYITQGNIVNIGVKAGDSSDGTDRVVVTGTVKANDPDDTPDSVYARVDDAVGNGLFTYLLDEEARLINAWDLEASKAESVKRVTASSSVSIDEMFDEAEKAAQAEKANEEMDEAEAAAEADKTEHSAEKANEEMNEAEAAAEADKAAAGGEGSDSSPEEDGATAPSKDTDSSSHSASKAQSSELGAGAIVGIAAGCVAAMALVALSYHMMCRTRKQEPNVTAMGITPPHVSVSVENPMV